jgi:hypothetical protein
MEYWNDGILEYRKNGMMERSADFTGGLRCVAADKKIITIYYRNFISGYQFAVLLRLAQNYHIISNQSLVNQ